MEMRPGYKRESTGDIPEDWDVASLDTIAKVKSGKRLPAGRSLTLSPTPYPYIRVSDLRQGTVFADNILYVPVDIAPKIKDFRIYSSDIFISVAGTLGIVGIVPTTLDGANLTENADRITDITCDQRYLYHVIAGDRIQSLISSSRTVGAQPKLAPHRIRSFPIPLPKSRLEQSNVSNALSDIDALIESLAQVIAKKRQIKQATMQELLTGKRRLPGHSDDWRMLRLRECVSERPRYGINAAGVPLSDALPTYLRITDISEEGEYIEEQKVSVRCSDDEYFVKSGDLFFARTGASVGRCYLHLDRNVKLVFAGFLIRVRVDQSVVDPAFMFLQTQLSSYRRWVAMMSMRSGQPGINAEEYMELRVKAPSISEQKDLIGVFSDMQDEINNIRSKLFKARQIKQGMMQELLTGRIRLV